MALPISSKIAPETTQEQLYKAQLRSNTREGSSSIVKPLVMPGDRLAKGLPAFSPVPPITEPIVDSTEYQASVDQQALEQGVTRDNLDRVEQGGNANVGAAGQRLRYLGQYDDGSSILAPAPASLINEEADKVTPLVGDEALLDVTALNLQTEQDNPGYLTVSRTGKALAKINSLNNYLIDESQVDKEFEAVADKLIRDPRGQVDVSALAHISAYTIAGALGAQNSFVANKRESQEATRESLKEIGVEMQERSNQSQIGMNQEQLILSMANRSRILYERINPEHDLSPRDFQVFGTKLFQRVMEEGELVTTQINNQHALLPTGSDNMGSLLGTASDLMVGADRQAGNSRVSSIGGAGPTRFPTLPHNKVQKRFSGTEINSAMLTANIIGRIPRGMFLDGVKTRVYELSNVISNMVFPDPISTTEYQDRGMLDPTKHLMYSSSEFASTFKMDLATAVAAWRSKIYQVGKASKDSEEANRRQQVEQIAIVNSINNTRLNNDIVRVNKQLKLTNEGGFANPNNAFFPTLAVADINGRMGYSGHDGDISGGKAIERQLQTFKSTTKASIPSGKKAHAAHSRKITSAANSLFAHEGNNTKFQAALDGMDKSTIHEIAFRCIMVGHMLKEGNSANKKKARGSTLNRSENEALKFLTDTQMAGVSNITYAVHHQIYLEVNQDNPIALESYFAGQGKEIAEALDSMSPKLETLVIPEFDLNESAKERTQKIVEAWGTIEIPNDTALQEHAAGRGDTQSKMSIRADALKYIEAYEGEGPNGFSWDFEVSIDAKQSGPNLQSTFAPGEHAAFTQNMLGKLPNSTLGDLRDFAEGLLLKKDTISGTFDNNKVKIDAWHGFLKNALQGEQANVTREILLKNPITQFFFGKPASMFGSSASDLLGYFRDDINANEYLKSLSSEEIVTDLAFIIEATLNHKEFDGTFSAAMKDLGLYLAMTNSDLVLRGPFGPINLSVESLEYVFRSKDIGAYKKGLPEELEPDIIQMMIKGYDDNGNSTETPLVHYVRSKQRTPQGTKGNFSQEEYVSGDNQRVGPGKRTSDSLSVLITHQVESGILNYSINKVNEGRKPENFIPVATVFDNVLTNGEGYFRYGHTYNNEAFDVLSNWDVFEALDEMVSNANKKFLKERSKDWKGRPVKGGDLAEHYNISVMQGSDGQTHRVERYAPMTAWLDKYYLNMPNKFDYPDPSELNTKQTAYMVRQTFSKAHTYAEKSGYQPPLINEFYLENGYLPADQALVLNAAERANMFLNRSSFDDLMTEFTAVTTSKFKKMKLVNKANKQSVKRKQGGRTPNNHLQQ